MAARQSVLVVDCSEETQEVLRAALVERNVDLLAARTLGHGLSLLKEHRPDLVVLDLESDSPSRTMAGRMATAAASYAAPVVILGRVRREPGPLAACPCFAKPYHYGPLVRKIEQLLGRAIDGAQRCDARAA